MPAIHRYRLVRMTTGGFDVWGPCPDCRNWTLETPALTPPVEVEAVLQEHARECPRLQAALSARVFGPDGPALGRVPVGYL